MKYHMCCCSNFNGEVVVMDCAGVSTDKFIDLGPNTN